MIMKYKRTISSKRKKKQLGSPNLLPDSIKCIFFILVCVWHNDDHATVVVSFHLTFPVITVSVTEVPLPSSHALEISWWVVAGALTFILFSKSHAFVFLLLLFFEAIFSWMYPFCSCTYLSLPIFLSSKIAFLSLTSFSFFIIII